MTTNAKSNKRTPTPQEFAVCLTGVLNGEIETNDTLVANGMPLVAVVANRRNDGYAGLGVTMHDNTELKITIERL